MNLSPLAVGFIKWSEFLHHETGQDPRRIVLPARAYEMLLAELRESCDRVTDGDPISGEGPDGRLWLGCTEIVRDTDT